MAAYSQDEVFRALADPSRRLLLDSLNERNGQTLRELCSRLDMARQSVSKHLAVLETASLVTTVRRGREKYHYLNSAPINDIAERWITRYERDRVHALADLKRALEDTPVEPEKPSFVYATYIRTTPEMLWQALTEPAFTERYWSITFETDWNQDSLMIWKTRGLTIVDPEQVVLESEPYRRLSYTWQTHSLEWLRTLDFTEEAAERLASEPRSKVTFDIEPLGDQVKLTVIHEDLLPGGLTGPMVSNGWPRVLANLKTLLETGETLPSLQLNTPSKRGLTR
ncbi:MAG: metalloregulator ArsR/SmtB family transcription factor [Acidobacteriota bacterium]|nr:metalloregulator ArsR/SmtB family transcription factor [Acidobacteriota bacterium]